MVGGESTSTRVSASSADVLETARTTIPGPFGGSLTVQRQVPFAVTVAAQSDPLELPAPTETWMTSAGVPVPVTVKGTSETKLFAGRSIVGACCGGVVAVGVVSSGAEVGAADADAEVDGD